jgi:hypothetical protein
MAKKATAKADGGRKIQTKSKASGSSGGQRSRSGSSSRSETRSEGQQTDIVDSLIKLLQSPLVIDLLAVGATAALAAITENRSSRAQGDSRHAKKTLKAAGVAAASAVGRRLKTEIDEIRKASQEAGEDRRAKAGTTA